MFLKNQPSQLYLKILLNLQILPILHYL